MSQESPAHGIGVTVGSGEPGIVPVAFVAVVQYVDADGVMRVTRVDSDGLTPERAAGLLEEATQ